MALLIVPFILKRYSSATKEIVSNNISKLPISSNSNSEVVKNIPFKELTIPYLRERSYYSALNELQVYAKNNDYTSYLTSYNSDGLNVNGLITIPNGEVPENGWPAIVFVHGYIPPTLYQTTSNYVAYVDYLAKSGFVVFKIDLRGHGNSEGEANGAYYSSDYVIDILNAKSALESSSFVNKNKIGLWGHSMGGNVTFRAFVADKNIPALVIWSGAVYTYQDFFDYRISDSSYQRPASNSNRQRLRDKIYETYGEFVVDSEFWQKVVPTNYLKEVNGAIQLNHAVNDSVVSIEYSRNLDKILDNSKLNHELNEYEAGGHNIEGIYFNQAMQNTVRFFNTYLR